MNPILSRLLAAAVAAGASKLAQVSGIVVDPATQASIVIFAYASLHKVLEGIKVTVKRAK